MTSPATAPSVSVPKRAAVVASAAITLWPAPKMIAPILSERVLS